MAKQDHIIQTQVFEINFSSQEKATEVQNRISQLFNNKLTPLMAELFDKHVPAEQLIKLDTLDLDLGTLPYFLFEDELTERFITEIEKELSGKLARLRDNPAADIPGLTVSKLKKSTIDLLEHFLLNGSMPWWATGSAAIDPDILLAELLSEDPLAVRQLLLKTGQNANARRRLVYQFSETLLRSVIRILEPEEAAFIFDYYAHILLAQKEKQVIRNESRGFEKEVYVFILSTILVDRGSIFNKKMFVKSTIQQMAAHYSIEYESLLFLFMSADGKKDEHLQRTDHFVVLIQELFTEHTRSKSIERSSGPPPKEKAGESREIFDLIKHYLLFGSLPLWSKPYEKAELQSLLSEWITQAPALSKELFTVLLRQKNTERHLLEMVDERLFLQIVKLAEEPESAFIIEYADILVKFRLKIKGSGSENTEVEQTVKKLILGFLFTDRSAVFHKAAFLEHTLRDSATYHNKSFHTFLSFLAQFIGEEYSAQSLRSPIFYLVTTLLRENKELQSPGALPENITPEALTAAEDLPAAAMQNILLRDVLAYFLKHGYLPWWGKEYISFSPEALLNELMERSPQDAVLLLKLSAAHAYSQQRLLSQFSKESLLKLITLLKDGTIAGELVNDLLHYSSTAQGLAALSSTDRAGIFLAALFETYREGAFKVFDPALFMETVVLRLSYKTGVDPVKILDTLKSGIGNRSIKFPEKENPAKFYPPENQAQLIDVLRLYLPGKESTGQEQLLNASLEILRYFLTWNKLPEHLNQLEARQKEVFLKQLLVLAGTKDPQALKNLFSRNTLSLSAKMFLHRVIALETSNEERSTKLLLSAYVEKDILNYLKEQSLTTGLHEADLHVFLSQVFNQEDSTGKKEILRQLLNAGKLIHHIAWQFPDKKFYELLKLTGNNIANETLDLLKDLQQLLRSAFTDTLEQQKLVALLREFSLHYYARQNPGTRASDFLKAFFDFLAAHAHFRSAALFNTLLKHATEAEIRNTFPAGKIKKIAESLRLYISAENNYRDLIQELKTSNDDLLSKFVGLEKQTSELLNIPGNKASEDYEKQPLNEPAVNTGEKIFIQNAGLILLHPFISTFFKRCGLTENINFISPEARHRAACLLQYLVYGTNDYAEHGLVLNKLLCGFPLQHPILPGFAPTVTETEIAQELLTEVARQWDKLKNTSLEGFQASFLQRNAVLTEGEESWTMKVEQRGYDVLLQTLPWGYTMIKTPWMTKFLYVEWT